MPVRILVLVYCIILSTGLFAQTKNKGILYVQNFSKELYGQHAQNWSIVQGKDGLMYFGNGNGLLEFDGNSWNLLKMPNKTLVRSLTIDKHGKIYIGAQGDFGTLEKDSIGNIRYHSLAKSIPDSIEGFGDIWKIHAGKDFLAMTASTVFIVWKNNTWQFINPKESTFYASFQIGEKLYVADYNNGLHLFKNNTLVAVEGCDIFKQRKIAFMVPFGEGKTLIGTAQNGMFIYDGVEAKPWRTLADNFLVQNQIKTGTLLKYGEIAIGTFKDGIIIIDKDGRPVQHVNATKGLQSNSVLSMCCDSSGNLWLGLENGIDLVQLNSPFTYFNTKVDLPGTGYISVVNNNQLYVGTSHGAFYKNWTTYENPFDPSIKFNMVENAEGQVWTINNEHENLLMGSEHGGFIIKNNKATRISDIPGVWLFRKWQKHPELLVEGTYSSLVLLKKDEKQKWVFRNRVGGFYESFRVVEEDYQGDFWLTHPYKGVYKVNIDDALDSIRQVQFYNSTHGLPSDLNIYVYKINGRPVFATEKGVYVYDDNTDRFEEDRKLNPFFKGKQVNKMMEDKSGNIWFVADAKPGMLLKTKDNYQRVEMPLNKLSGKMVSGFEHINIIDSANIIFGVQEGFIHYDPKKAIQQKNTFYTHIRKVEHDKQNKLFLAGRSDTLKDRRIVLPYAENELRFTYSCTNYEDLDKNQYQYKLEGFDKTWSEWTGRTIKEYTNLPEGNYVFKVRSKNLNDLAGEEDSFAFTIDPPFYRTTLAYVLYGILSCISLYALVTYNSIRKEKQFRFQRLEANRIINKLEKDKLENEVNFKQRELASLALHMTSKNEILEQIKTQLKNSIKNTEAENGPMNQIIKLIDTNIKLDKNWDQFDFYFDQVHGNFIERLKNKYPDLTGSQIKLCAYLRMNLSSKEIATLMNISVGGIEKSRYRLRKKFNLEHDLMLTEFIQKI